MKKILLLLLLIPVLSFGQKTVTELGVQNNSQILLKGPSQLRSFKMYDSIRLSFVNLLGSYADPSWITSLAPSKLTGWPANSSGVLTNNGSGTLSWAASGGSGTVTTVSVASANGFAGTVANATTTPAITLSTSVNGLLKANGTAVSAATPRTDYTGSYPTVSSTASTASLTPDPTVNDEYIVTALAVGLTINNPSTNGSGYSFLISIKDNATPQTITWDTQYRGVGGTLPGTTSSSTTIYLPCIYNSADSKWDVSISGVSGTTNQIAYFTSATGVGSLTTATYPSLTELSYVKGVTSGIQAQINAIAGGWAVTGTTTLTGAATIASTTPAGLAFTNTSTATANNQALYTLTGTSTSENVNGDNWNGLYLNMNMTRNGGNPTTQTGNAVLINGTWSNGGTANILKLQNAGTDLYTFTPNSATFSKSINGQFALFISNQTSGTSAQAGISLGSTTASLFVGVNSAAFTTSNMNVANTMIVQANGGNGLNIGTVSATQFSIWTNNVSRMSIASGGDMTYSGNILLGTAGNKISIKSGTNASAGHVTLSGGTATVSTTAVTANSEIHLTVQTLGTVSVAKAVAVTTKTAGTSFVITSADATDTSIVSWWIMDAN